MSAGGALTPFRVRGSTERSVPQRLQRRAGPLRLESIKAGVEGQRPLQQLARSWLVAKGMRNHPGVVVEGRVLAALGQGLPDRDICSAARPFASNAQANAS